MSATYTGKDAHDHAVGVRVLYAEKVIPEETWIQKKFPCGCSCAFPSTSPAPRWCPEHPNRAVVR